MSAIGDQTNLDINLKWLLQIVAGVGFAAWGYFTLTSHIRELEIEVMRMRDSVVQNSEFRTKWPLGELGALPDDAEQNMRLKHLEDKMGVVEKQVDALRIRDASTNPNTTGDK